MPRGQALDVRNGGGRWTTEEDDILLTCLEVARNRIDAGGPRAPSGYEDAQRQLDRSRTALRLRMNGLRIRNDKRALNLMAHKMDPELLGPKTTGADAGPSRRSTRHPAVRTPSFSPIEVPKEPGTDGPITSSAEEETSETPPSSKLTQTPPTLISDVGGSKAEPIEWVETMESKYGREIWEKMEAASLLVAFSGGPPVRADVVEEACRKEVAEVEARVAR